MGDAEIGNNMERPFLGKLYFALFLWKIGLGELETARRYLAEAIRLFPSLVERYEEFSQAITDWAVKHSYGPPATLAQRVLDNLPDDLVRSGQLRRRVLGKTHIARAFAEYARGHGAQARYHILNGLSYDPSYLKNKGAMATFARSFLNRHIPAVKSDLACSQLDNDSVPKSVLRGGEVALDCAVDSVERITGGYSGNKIYLIKSGDQPYILRLVGRDDLEQRIAVVERVQAVGVPTPAILAHASLPSSDDEPIWLLEEWSSGSSFDPQRVSPSDELVIVAELGRYLRRLHTINTRGFGRISSAQLDAPYPTFDAWLDSQQQAVERGCLIGAIPEAALSALAAADRFLRESYAGPSVLCHYDLSDYNVLVDAGRVRAIIDWGDAGGGDPAYDIAAFLTSLSHYWYPAKDHEILRTILQAYDIDEPNNFYRRVIAHRLLFAAREVVRFLHEEKNEYFKACWSILTDANLVH